MEVKSFMVIASKAPYPSLQVCLGQGKHPYISTSPYNLFTKTLDAYKHEKYPQSDGIQCAKMRYRIKVQIMNSGRNISTLRLVKFVGSFWGSCSQDLNVRGHSIALFQDFPLAVGCTHISCQRCHEIRCLQAFTKKPHYDRVTYGEMME